MKSKKLNAFESSLITVKICAFAYKSIGSLGQYWLDYQGE